MHSYIITFDLDGTPKQVDVQVPFALGEFMEMVKAKANGPDFFGYTGRVTAIEVIEEK